MKRYLTRMLKGACMMGIVLSLSLLFSMGNVLAADTVVPSAEYPTLASAFNARKTSIVLAEDMTIQRQSLTDRALSPVHINLNGHTLTCDNAQIKVNTDGASLKISNGTILAGNYTFFVNYRTTLELSNVTIKGNGQSTLALLSDTKGSATIKLVGGEISGFKTAFEMNAVSQGMGYRFTLDENNRTVFNNTADISNGNKVYINLGVYISDKGKFVFKNPLTTNSEEDKNESLELIRLKRNETMNLNENGCCRKQHIRFWSSDSRIASVTHCGKIRARRPGECKIYVKTGKALRVLRVIVEK